MRISTNLYFQTGLNSVNRQQAQLMEVFQQIGSGKRALTPADDPLAAAQSITLAQAQSMNKRFAENRHVASRMLSEEENVLNSLTSQVRDVKTRLVEVGNGTLSDADRATLANVLRDSMESLLGLANSKDASGQYLFSGSQGQVAPYVYDGNRVVYKGDQVERLVQVDQTRQLPSSNNGMEVFSRVTPGSNAFLTSATSGNSGTGTIAQPSTVNPKEAQNMMSFEVRFLDDKTYVVDTHFVNDQGQPEMLTSDPQNYDVNNKGESILNLPFGNVSSGVSVSFSGTPAAGDSFTIERALSTERDGFPATDLNMFNTLSDLINVLEQPSSDDPVEQAALRNQLNSAMQRLDINYNNILTVRASVGGRMNEIAALNDNGSLQALHLSNELIRLEDLDYYTASSQLQQRSAALEASVLAFKKIQSASLLAMRA